MKQKTVGRCPFATRAIKRDHGVKRDGGVELKDIGSGHGHNTHLAFLTPAQARDLGKALVQMGEELLNERR